VCGAFAIDLEGGRVRSARVAYGGMAPIPLRSAGAEAALHGKPWTEANVEAAAAAVGAELSPISDLRASAAYRRLASANMLRKLWIEPAGLPGPARAADAGGSR
jgi:xanthine dehydrogenase small subunit